MIKVIPFDKERLYEFDYDGVERTYMSPEEARRLSALYATRGMAYMIELKGLVIVTGGVAPVAGTTGQAWLFVNRAAQEYKKSIFKRIKLHLEDMISELKLDTVNILCIEDSFEANNLAVHLGFKKKNNFTLYQKSGD